MRQCAIAGVARRPKLKTTGERCVISWITTTGGDHQGESNLNLEQKKTWIGEAIRDLDQEPERAAHDKLQLHLNSHAATSQRKNRKYAWVRT